VSAGRAEAGRRGEAAAARHLEAHGYRIRARNFRTRRGEIDLVAEREGEVVFVEVRFRTSASHGTPSETVGPRKRLRILRAASAYLAAKGLGESPCRFDLVALTPAGTGGLEILHIENAFDREGRATGHWSG
jgi:putative endonuclease